MSSLALSAVHTFPRIKKQEHIVLCHPQHENTTPEAPHDHTPRQTGNLVSLTPSLIHTIHTRQHTNPRPLRTRSMPRTRSNVGAAAISRTITPRATLARSPFMLPRPFRVNRRLRCTTSALDRISSTTRSAFAMRTSCGGLFHRVRCSQAHREPRRHPRSPMPHTPPSNFPSSTPPPPPRDEALTVSVRRCTLRLLAAREVSGHLGGTPQGRVGEKEQEDCGIARSILLPMSLPLPKYTFSFLFFFLRVAELVVVLV
ncbi:hypothetical protein B0H13DRAFT_2370831 [Mycena leptocephala]|nr:hypothetical protein B0H13DRAFT_2370831 [Mycena leptocephala]